MLSQELYSISSKHLVQEKAYLPMVTHSPPKNYEGKPTGKRKERKMRNKNVLFGGSEMKIIAANVVLLVIN